MPNKDLFPKLYNLLYFLLYPAYKVQEILTLGEEQRAVLLILEYFCGQSQNTSKNKFSKQKLYDLFHSQLSTLSNKFPKFKEIQKRESLKYAREVVKETIREQLAKNEDKFKNEAQQSFERERKIKVIFRKDILESIEDVVLCGIKKRRVNEKTVDVHPETNMSSHDLLSQDQPMFESDNFSFEGELSFYNLFEAFDPLSQIFDHQDELFF